MTEEEYFRKNYPDSCYGDRPLSPYWDFFQDGVEFGERQSETKIEEIENYFVKSAGYGRDKVRNFMDIVNKALKQKGERIEQLEKENAKLKSVAEFQQSSNMKRHFEIQELEKKNAKLESDFRICEKNADTYYDQLTKAKDLLKEAQGYIENIDDELYDEIEQFLEKHKCKYAEDKSGDVYECNGYYTREVEYPFQHKDLNPDGSVNICECKKYEAGK